MLFVQCKKNGEKTICIELFLKGRNSSFTWIYFIFKERLAFWWRERAACNILTTSEEDGMNKHDESHSYIVFTPPRLLIMDASPPSQQPKSTATGNWRLISYQHIQTKGDTSRRSHICSIQSSRRYEYSRRSFLFATISRWWMTVPMSNSIQLWEYSCQTNLAFL